MMKLDFNKAATWLMFAVLTGFLAGCAGNKPRPVVERGWVGGQFRMARVPKLSATNAVAAATTTTPAVPAPKSGLLVTALQTNTPAGLAGLRRGDFVIEVNQKPVKSLKDFLRGIDAAKPGDSVPVKAWRQGAMVESRMCVGRETYRKGGYVAFELPTIVHGWDFPGWGNGLSLVFIGCDTGPANRAQIPPDKAKRDVYSYDVRTWLVLFEVSKGKHILSQETVSPKTTRLPDGSTGGTAAGERSGAAAAQRTTTAFASTPGPS